MEGTAAVRRGPDLERQPFASDVLRMQHELELHRLHSGPDPEAGELDARLLVAGWQLRVDLDQFRSAQEPAQRDVAVVRFRGRRRRHGLGWLSELALEGFELRTPGALGVCSRAFRQRGHHLPDRDPREDDGGENDDRCDDEGEPGLDRTIPRRGRVEGEQRLDGGGWTGGALARRHAGEEGAEARGDVQVVEEAVVPEAEDVQEMPRDEARL